MAKRRTTEPCMVEYTFRVGRAQKKIDACMEFLELQRGWRKYAKQYPERVKAAELLLDKAMKAMQESAYAFLGGSVEVVIEGS